MSTRIDFLKFFPDFTWDWSTQEIEKRVTQAMTSTTQLYDSISKTDKNAINYETVVEPIGLHEGMYQRVRNIVELYNNVSTDKAIRDISNESIKKLADFEVDISMRKDIFNLLTNVQFQKVSLSSFQQRLMDKMVVLMKRRGLCLPDEVLNQVKEMDKHINTLSAEFNKNAIEEDTVFELSSHELNGMNQDFMAGLEKSEDKYKVSLKYPHVFPILKMCTVVSTRKMIYHAFNSRCIGTNVAILEEILSLRFKRAQILGYTNHADYVTEILMSKKSKNVEEFLLSLAEKLKVSGKKELARLLELKKQECQKLGLEFDGKVNPWDSSYYQRIVEETDFAIDKEAIREYFPFEHVHQELMEIYQSLLHLKFVKVEDAPVWHSEVSLYAVYDTGNNKDLMGYFYLDIFPRPGKYGHAACFQLQDNCKIPGGQQLSLAAMVANFTKSLPNKPSLLTHDEVETYFHEFGHAMHHICCTKAEYSSLGAFSIETDFVEAPSQMLENWVWDKVSLKKISCHYKTNEKLTDELISKLCNSRKANVSLHYLRQIALSLVDYSYHVSTFKVDTFEVINKYFTELVGISPSPGTNFSASFCHLVGGYDARYYGYLWSLVYSSDMYCSRFKKEGIFNVNTGLDYRLKILQPGSSKDANQLLRDFLGREPIQDSFLELIGV